MKRLSIFLFLLPLCLFTYSLLANVQTKIDSLEKITRSSKDTNLVHSLISLSEEYQNTGQPEKAMETAKQAQKESEKLQYKTGIAQSLYRQGALLSEGTDMEEAISHYKKALVLAEELGNLSIQANCLSSMGSVCRRMGNYVEGLEYFFKALKIFEKLGQENEERCLMGIGVLYGKQKNYSKAIEYLSKALETAEKRGNIRMQSRILINTGVVYFDLGEYEKSIGYYKRVLESAERLNDLSMKQASYSNIGGIYIMLEQYEKGHEYCSKALEIARIQKDKENIVITTGNIGEAYAGMKKYDLAEKNYLEALRLSQEIGLKDATQYLYMMLSEFYERRGDYKKTHEYFKLYSVMKDSLMNKESSKLIAEIDAKYQSEKKQKQIELQQLELAKQKAELNKQRIISINAVGGIVLLLLLGFLLYNRYQLKQKANAKLQVAYEQIEEKNLQITDSIDYAKRIQEAILPDQDEIQRLFPESFIFFKPRDIVSGDFYWYSAQNSKIIIAVADCTGHGVPGAFMSIIGNTLLNEIVNVKRITDPGRILEQLNEGVINALHQDKEADYKQHDGMEIGICSIDLSCKELSFAGSRHNLYMFGNDKQLIEVKGDRSYIGGFMNNGLKIFTSHTLPLAKGTTVYLSTDGFIDQSGDNGNKRFTSRRFKEMLISLQDRPARAHKQLMEIEFEQWKGTQQQKDDVLVMGIKC